MAFTPKFSTLAVNTKADAEAALADGGTLDVYDGTQPANADAPITTQTLLVSLTLPSPAFGAAVAGVATANPITTAVASAGGTPTWFRLRTSGAATIADGSAGVSGTNVLVSHSPIVAGASITATLFTLTESRG
jgi:hypothetical protein